MKNHAIIPASSDLKGIKGEICVKDVDCLYNWDSD